MFGYNTTSFAQNFICGAVGALIEVHDFSQQAIAQAKQLDQQSRKQTMKSLSQTYTFLLCAESLTQWVVSETVDRVTTAYNFVHRHLTSDEAKAFYQFVQDVCLMVILLGRLAREAMDRYVEECRYTPDVVEEFRDFDAQLNASAPAPVEVAIAEDAAEEEAIPSAETPAAEISQPVEPDWSAMGVRELRVECKKYDIPWRNCYGPNEHMNKDAMIDALHDEWMERRWMH